MCGILGIIDHEDQIHPQLVVTMTDTLRHRGPDGEGYLIGDLQDGYKIWNAAGAMPRTTGNFALGHRRLSVLDFATGSQPMVNEDQKIIIVFNGEIYNFKELRQQLEGLGHRFLSDHSDTETIIHAYEEWGVSCLKHLRGMFAFGIVDLIENRLFLARDRMGQKPLYYYHANGKFVFASEIKAILADDRIPRRLSPQSLVDYLALGYVLSPKSIYRDIHKLRPGHFLSVPLNQPRIDPAQELYWSPSLEPDLSKTEDEWMEETRHELSEAVRMRMISDAPLGAFLSGGIDSTAIVALMSSTHSGQIKTFSVDFKEKKFSETAYARRVAEKYGTEYHETTVHPDAMELLPRLAWQCDEPLGDSSVIPTYYVSKMAREHITVALSGDGGDEIFAGYQRYSDALDQAPIDRLPGSMKTGLRLAASAYPFWLRGKGFLTRLSMDEKDRYLQMITSPVYKQLLRWSLISDGADRHPLEEVWDGELTDYLSQMQSLDTRSYLPDNILAKVDRTSMLCSLETRSPLLDHKLVELVGSMPTEFKIKDRHKKYPLKKILSNDWGDDFLERRKMGFGVPMEYWFKQGEFDSLLNDTLLSETSLISKFISKKAVKRLVNYHMRGTRDFSVEIWRLLFLEVWAQTWKPTE